MVSLTHFRPRKSRANYPSLPSQVQRYSKPSPTYLFSPSAWARCGIAAVVVLLLTISRRGVFFLLILRRNAPMADKPSDLVQGTLDMLILKTLALEPMHGYGIAVRLEQMSKGVFRLNAGSLFVAFQRLQRDGLF